MNNLPCGPPAAPPTHPPPPPCRAAPVPRRARKPFHDGHAATQGGTGRADRCGALTWRLSTSGSGPPETLRSEHSPLAPESTRRRPGSVTADTFALPEGGAPVTPVSPHSPRSDTGVPAQINHRDG